MRISAEEARKNSDLKTSGEAILNYIFSFIKDASDLGRKEIRIYSTTGFGNCPHALVREVFNNKEKYKYIEETLISLGYKVTNYLNDFIIINWE